jgi:hypothetical protein
MIQSRVWRRGGATCVEALLSLGLAAGIALVIANSIVRAGWVANSGFLPCVAVTGALILGILALTRLPWPLGLGLGLGAAPAVAGLATLPGATLVHLADPRALAGLAGQLSRWSPDQVAIALFGSILALLAWVAGGWLAWCTLRWRQPLVGLVPGAAALATGMTSPPGETPQEFGKRLGERFPEAAAAAEGLAAGYTLAAYGPPARARDGGEAVRASWEDLLPILLRRALHRLLPARSVPATGSP